MSARTWLVAGLLAIAALPASAQQSTTNDDTRGRVAVTTDGDAGLWWLPVADTNGKKNSRGSAQRNSFNTPQGQMNVANFTANVSYGFTDRLDVFGSWDVVQRVDRDNAPGAIFNSDRDRGGVDPRAVYAAEDWSGNTLGDLRVGLKYAVASEAKGNGVGFAPRAFMTLPTGDSKKGGGVGNVAVDLGAVLSKWANRNVVFTADGGYNFRKNPEKPVVAHVPNYFHWGGGVGITPNDHWLIHGELFGRAWQRNTTSLDGTLVADDGTLSPRVTDTKKTTSLAGGITWFATNGFFIGGELRMDTPKRAKLNASNDYQGHYIDYHVRIGWVPKRVVPPPPAPTPPPPTPPAPAPRAHDLSVKANCNPCTVEVGKTSQVTSVATDSIGCVVTYAWSAPTGTFADRTQQNTVWTAPMQEGAVPVTVTVTCPQDSKTASDTVTIQVIRPAAKVYTFEDVHFDFDRYTLRPEAARVLEQAVAAMKEDATLRLTIEGHTCSIGTAEYNMALGERRANAVRDYLTQNGVAATRLQTVSYGEEKPKHDNSREETRRLNRRAALIVRLDR